MVKAYFDHFKDVHIVIYDDFKQDPKKEIYRVLSFLNIKNNVAIDSDKIVNKGGMQWNSYLIKQIFMSNSLIKKFLRLILSKKSRRILYKLLTSFFVQQAPPVSEKIKKAFHQNCKFNFVDNLINLKTKFDLIICVNTFQYAPNPNFLIGTMKRLLSHKGKIFFMNICLDTYPLSINYGDQYIDDQIYKNLYSYEYSL